MLIASTTTRTACQMQQRITSCPRIAFVFGAPRSGTTWLGKLLDSSPSVAYLHEPINKGRGLMIHRAIRALRQGQPLEPDIGRQAAQDLIHNYGRFLQPPFFRKEFAPYTAASSLAWSWLRLTGRPARCLVGPRDPQQVGAVVVKDGLCWFSRPLTEALNAKALILLRHPCGVVNSMLRGQQIGAMEKSSRDSLWLSHSQLLRELGYRKEDLFDLADDELEALCWLAAYHEVPTWSADDRFKILTYHQTVTSTPALVEELFPWLGLPITDQTRAFVKSGRKPGGDWLRRLLGARKLYYAVAPRSERPDLAWQKELSRDSQQRILKIVASFPMERYWPEAD
jgi:hypothetical protein